MKYALIGCGRIATNHIAAALDNDLEIVALCDVYEPSMEQLVSEHGLENNQGIKRYTDYKQMLIEEPAIDLVAITTISGLHASVALDCIKAGKHVIIEKPIALSMSDADEIIKKSEEMGVFVCACHQNRYNGAIQKLRKALEADRFGKLSHGSVHVRWNRGEEYYSQASWRGTWAQDGGCLMNQCVHAVDLLYWMMGGEVESVYAQTRRRFHNCIEAEDVGVAVLTFSNGAIATIEGTVNIYPENLEETLCIFGEKGTVKIGGKSVNMIETWDFEDCDNEDQEHEGFNEEVPNIYGNGHMFLYADMKQAIQEGRKPYIDVTAGRDVLEIVLAMYKSQKTGQPVYLPLKDFSTEQMKGEFS